MGDDVSEFDVIDRLIWFLAGMLTAAICLSAGLWALELRDRIRQRRRQQRRNRGIEQ